LLPQSTRLTFTYLTRDEERALPKPPKLKALPRRATAKASRAKAK
jgi:hypothetical protein